MKLRKEFETVTSNLMSRVPAMSWRVPQRRATLHHQAHGKTIRNIL